MAGGPCTVAMENPGNHFLGGLHIQVRVVYMTDLLPCPDFIPWKILVSSTKILAGQSDCTMGGAHISCPQFEKKILSYNYNITVS